MKENPVSNPNHYLRFKLSPIRIIEIWKLCFNAGNVIKYLLRSPYKGKELEDLEKALWSLLRHYDLRSADLNDTMPCDIDNKADDNPFAPGGFLRSYYEYSKGINTPVQETVVEKSQETRIEEIEPSLADLEEVAVHPAAIAFDEAAKEDDVYKDWRLRSLVRVPVMEGVEQSNWPCPICGDRLALETIAHVCEDGYAHPHEFIKIVASDGSTTAK